MRALNSNLAATGAPPIMAAQRWIAETPLPGDRPLLNLSQAAPTEPPPAALRAHLADAMLSDPGAHGYGPVLGNPDLRAEIASRWQTAYAGPIAPEHVAVTAGCNEAFCVAVATACAPGDAVLLPAPWYFNHKMWLDMSGVGTVPLPTGPDMLPDIERARAAMTPDVRAIVLVSPNNPSGAEYPAALIEAFFDLAEASGAVLILDETYRDYHSAEGAPHGLFARPGWGETLIHLYSFSKIFRIMGHRTGALIAGTGRIGEAEKVLDTITICPGQTGQIAALEGLRTLGPWIAAERAEILARRNHLVRQFAERLPDWTVRGAGAYFAWVEPRWDEPADRLARRLLGEQGVLTLPGNMFLPAQAPTRALRIAFANTDSAGITQLADRLAVFGP